MSTNCGNYVVVCVDTQFGVSIEVDVVITDNKWEGSQGIIHMLYIWDVNHAKLECGVEFNNVSGGYPWDGGKEEGLISSKKAVDLSNTGALLVAYGLLRYLTWHRDPVPNHQTMFIHIRHSAGHRDTPAQ